jgi:sugar/nucleoside kinase (ribokinase family)
MNKTFDVIGLGVSTVDLLNVVDHFPDKEEVQKSVCSTMQGGGPIATAIVTLARLGAKVAMIDSIGDDWFSKQIVNEFRSEKVETCFIKTNHAATSSMATILVRKSDGARTIIFSPGNSPIISADEITPELISQAKYIHMNGRHFNACLKACSVAKSVGTKISFDGGSHRFREELKEIIPLTNICIIAKEFAVSCTSNTEISAAAKTILNSGPEIVIITDGLNGSFLFTKEIDGYHQKAFKLESTVDTTGCGDSYHGAFLFGLVYGYNLYESMKFASAVATINSTKLGGRAALPDLETVFKFLEKH